MTDEPMLEPSAIPSRSTPTAISRGSRASEDWPVMRFVRPVRLRDRLPVPSRPTLAVGGALVAAAARCRRVVVAATDA